MNIKVGSYCDSPPQPPPAPPHFYFAHILLFSVQMWLWIFSSAGEFIGLVNLGIIIFSSLLSETLAYKTVLLKSETL